MSTIRDEFLHRLCQKQREAIRQDRREEIRKRRERLSEFAQEGDKIVHPSKPSSDTYVLDENLCPKKRGSK